MNPVIDWLIQNQTLVISLVIAIIGWIFTVRLHRSLLRRQHTFSAIMDAHFDDKYQKANKRVRCYVRERKQFPNLDEDEHKKLKEDVRFLLNHYEFLAAGVRAGDVDEGLLKKCEEDTILGLYNVSGGFIQSTRNNGNWPFSYQNVKWLCHRWDNPPCWIQRKLEWLLCRPLRCN